MALVSGGGGDDPPNPNIIRFNRRVPQTWIPDDELYEIINWPRLWDDPMDWHPPMWPPPDPNTVWRPTFVGRGHPAMRRLRREYRRNVNNVANWISSRFWTGERARGVRRVVRRHFYDRRYN